MKIITYFITLFLLSSLVSAVSQQELTEAKALIDSKTPCANLSNEQLELIGEYTMEQMNSGEAHTQMHTAMGLQEGSEQEKSFHINLAKMMYCGKGSMMGGSGMMNQGGPTAGNTGQGGMMQGGNVQGNTLGTPNAQGMMGQQAGTQGYGMLGSGMLGGYQSSEWSIFSILYVVLLVGIILIVYLSAVKVLKELMQPKDASQAKQKAKE